MRRELRARGVTGVAAVDGAPEPTEADLPEGIVCPVPAPAAGATVLIGRNVLGRGNDELGGVLMKGVLYAMAQRDEVPKKIIFYNSGAYLTSEDSASLDDIRELAAAFRAEYGDAPEKLPDQERRQAMHRH